MATTALGTTNIQEHERVAALRAAFPAIRRWTYMNTGTTGPMPEVVAEAMRDSLEHQAHEARTGAERGEQNRELKAEIRSATASLLGCDPGEIALTHNTTEGMNLITLGVNWVAGDEAVTSDAEHPGALFPLYAAQGRFNLTIRTAAVAGRDRDGILESFASAIGPRTKLVSISHVSFSTGQVLPVREIAELAHANGALLLVDGAQSFGAMALDVAALGVDAYAVPAQKWLCGPEGAGALYCAQGVVSQLRVTFAGYGTAEGFNDFGGFQVRANAQRFEQGTANPAVFAGQLAATNWLANEVTEELAYRRSHELGAYAIARLGEIPGVTVCTPADHAGLVTAAVGAAVGADRAAAIVTALGAKDILIRAIRQLGAVRLSLAYYNTTEEIDTVAAEIAAAITD